MDVFSTISGIGGLGSIVLGCAFLLFKCCKGRKFHTKSGCIDIELSAEVSPEEREEK